MTLVIFQITACQKIKLISINRDIKNIKYIENFLFMLFD